MASRMAMYDLMLNQTYGMEVMGVVLYLGNDPLRMNSEHSFFDFRYQCKMIDVRQLDPEVFLASDNAGEIIFAILTGEDGLKQKEVTIRKIFAKLQLLYADDRAMLLVKIKQLEMLSLLRGKFIQQKILEEERNMAVTIDIREDLRYQQGLGEGIEKGIERGIEIGAERILFATAEKMLINGMDISLVQSVTGLPKGKLEEIAKKLADSHPG